MHLSLVERAQRATQKQLKRSLGARTWSRDDITTEIKRICGDVDSYLSAHTVRYSWPKQFSSYLHCHTDTHSRHDACVSVEPILSNHDHNFLKRLLQDEYAATKFTELQCRRHDGHGDFYSQYDRFRRYSPTAPSLLKLTWASKHHQGLNGLRKCVRALVNTSHSRRFISGILSRAEDNLRKASQDQEGVSQVMRNS